MIGGLHEVALYGGAGHDTLIARDRPTIHERQWPYDVQLHGDAGRDDMDAGSMYDLLDGGRGADVYRFAVGDAIDVVLDPDGRNLLVFGPGISVSDLEISRRGEALHVEYANHDAAWDQVDKVRFDKFYAPNSDPARPLVRQRFGDVAFVDDGLETRHSLVDLAGGGETSKRIGQVGSVEVAQAQRGDATWVAFDKPIKNAIVVLGLVSDNGEDPVIARVVDTTRKGFYVRLDEWGYLDGAHTTETVPWMAISKGDWLLESGLSVHADQISLTHKRTDPGVPADAGHALVATVTGEGRAAPVAPRGSLTEIKLQEEEGENGRHKAENVNVVSVAVESDLPDVYAMLSDRDASPGFTDAVARHLVGEATNYVENAAWFGMVRSFNQRDPAILRLTAEGMSYGDSYFEGFLQEERSADAETSHDREQVGWFVLEEGILRGFDISDGLV